MENKPQYSITKGKLILGDWWWVIFKDEGTALIGEKVGVNQFQTKIGLIDSIKENIAIERVVPLQ